MSGHSLQFNVIFIIKTSVLLNGVLGKNWHFSSDDSLYFNSYVHMQCRSYLSLGPSKFRNYDPLTTTRVHMQLNYKRKLCNLMLFS